MVRRQRSMYLTLGALCLLGLANSAAAYHSAHERELTVAQLAASPPSGAHSAASELSSLRDIAADALRSAEGGDLRAARTRMDDLEHRWTRVAPEVKSQRPDKWKAIDSAIDRAERELRFWRARRTDSVEALRQVVTVLDETT